MLQYNSAKTSPLMDEVFVPFRSSRDLPGSSAAAKSQRPHYVEPKTIHLCQKSWVTSYTQPHWYWVYLLEFNIYHTKEKSHTEL